MRDLDEIFARLAKSPFRKRFRLGPKERGYLATKGLAIVIDHARAFIDERLAPANPRNDGKQNSVARPSGLHRPACNGDVLPLMPREMARHSERR